MLNEQMKNLRKRFINVFLRSQTTSTRFWFGLTSLGFCSFLINSSFSTSPHSEYYMMYNIAPLWVWAAGFFVHAMALWYGVFLEKFNNLLLLTEGVLGVALWTASAAAVTIYQGAIGANAAGACIALWLLVRYPTHHEWVEQRNFRNRSSETQND